MKFHVTYDIITHESAEQGDYAESGFVTPGGWKYHALADGEFPDPIEEYEMTLREAARLVDGVHSNGDGSFYESDSRIDYQTGEHETRALHCPRNITRASLRRVARVLGVRL
jgi:hypothetical protein